MELKKHLYAYNKLQMIQKHLVILFISAFFSGCVTGYVQSTGGPGYSETQLAADTFVVTYRANSNTSQERTYDLALLRCAELCTQSGFAYFTTSNVNRNEKSVGGMMVNNLYMAVGEPEVSMQVRFTRTNSAAGSLEAKFVSSSIRAKHGIAE